MTEPIRIQRRGTAAVLILHRPDRRNALSRDLVLAIGRVGPALLADPGVRAVVLTGSGEAAFCAGADLKERQGMSPDQVREFLDLCRSEWSWLETARVPTIAALNGAALGGGLELALCCDLRVAADHAILGLPETSLAIVPGAGGTQRLPRLVGTGQAMELILRASRITASEALAIGLVNRVTPVGSDVVNDTLAWIEPILSGAPIAIEGALGAVRAARSVSLEEGLQLERAAYEKTLASEDRLEALAAFAEKRKPSFEGK